MQKLENKYISNGVSELIALVKVWRTKEYAGTSRFVAPYESALSQYFRSKHAVAVSNGTDAIEVALRSLDIPRGSEVMLPSYAPVMSVIPIIHAGLTPVFIDSEPSSFSLSIEDMSKKITPLTRAILVVPMWGYPIAMKELRRWAKVNGRVRIIEDASHCHGSLLDGSYVGTFSDVSTFSTQERKLVSTGEGGFLLTPSTAIRDKAFAVRDFGKVQPSDKHYAEHVGEYGIHDGSNFRITGVGAALGLSQLKKLDKKITKRTDNARKILSAIKHDKRYSELRNTQNTRNNYYSLVLTLNGVATEDLGKALADNGIISDTYRFKIKPLYKLPLFAHYSSPCPNTEKFLQSIITLPTHEGLKKADLERIISTLLSFEADT